MLFAIFTMLLLVRPGFAEDLASTITGTSAVVTDTEVRDSEKMMLPGKVAVPDDFCTKASGGEIPGFSFRFFDRGWHYQSWEEARANVIKACAYWNDHMQDAGSILALSKAREHYADLSLRAQDEMVDATIRRLGPARDQTDTGTCYAQAVADLASYHIGKRVSAMSVAVRYAQHVGWIKVVAPRGMGNGGELGTTVQASAHGSLCAEDQVPGKPSYYQVTLDKFENTYQTRFRNVVGAKSGVLQELNGYAHSLEPGLPSDDFIRNLRPAQTLEQALGGWQDRQCNLRLTLPGSVVTRGLFTPWEIEAALDSKEPVVVNLDAQVLQGRIPWIRIANHAALVVAEITIEGSKYFLLRNSWGPYCGSYSRNLPARCREGHVWLRESEIVRAVQSVTYVRHPN